MSSKTTSGEASTKKIRMVSAVLLDTPKVSQIQPRFRTFTFYRISIFQFLLYFRDYRPVFGWLQDLYEFESAVVDGNVPVVRKLLEAQKYPTSQPQKEPGLYLKGPETGSQVTKYNKNRKSE